MLTVTDDMFESFRNRGQVVIVRNWKYATLVGMGGYHIQSILVQMVTPPIHQDVNPLEPGFGSLHICALL